MSFTTTIHCHKCKKSQVCQWSTAPRGWLIVRTNYEISGGAHGDSHRVQPQPMEDHYCPECAPTIIPAEYMKTHCLAHYFAPVPPPETRIVHPAECDNKCQTWDWPNGGDPVIGQHHPLCQYSAAWRASREGQ